MTAHLNRPPLSTLDALSPLEAQSGGSLPQKGWEKSLWEWDHKSEARRTLHYFRPPIKKTLLFQSYGYV